MKRVVVELSGGADSALTLVRVLREVDKKEVHALFVGYGQRYAREERETSRAVFRKLIGNQDRWHYATLITSFAGVEKTGSVEVPMRNLVIGALAASLAGNLGADTVVVGSKSKLWNRDDEYSFKDSTTVFYEALNQTVLVAGGQFKVRQLLAEGVAERMSKVAVYEELLLAGVQLTDTFSCYTPVRFGGLQSRECGECRNCEEKGTVAQELGISKWLREV